MVEISYTRPERVEGTVRRLDTPGTHSFSGWLELLRLLEAPDPRPQPPASGPERPANPDN
jgi:hypothetical protein